MCTAHTTGHWEDIIITNKFVALQLKTWFVLTWLYVHPNYHTPTTQTDGRLLLCSGFLIMNMSYSVRVSGETGYLLASRGATLDHH